MTKEEFFEWFDACPTHKCEILEIDDDGYVRILTKIQEYKKD